MSASAIIQGAHTSTATAVENIGNNKMSIGNESKASFEMLKPPNVIFNRSLPPPTPITQDPCIATVPQDISVGVSLPGPTPIGGFAIPSLTSSASSAAPTGLSSSTDIFSGASLENKKVRVETSVVQNRDVDVTDSKTVKTGVDAVPDDDVRGESVEMVTGLEVTIIDG
jgi:hypothetical protein